jgi:[acyl-carrier-protein] S-malonyltransferase
MGGIRTAFLFPGQGSQTVGMGADLFREDPAARRLFEAANDAAGADVTALCFKGPFESLSRTRVLQPAITAVNLACRAWLEAHGVVPDAAAGHSLGELSALACTGCVADVDAVRLAAARGKAMDDAATATPGTMIAVVGLEAAVVIAEAAALLDRKEGGVANLNGPDQIVLSGTTAAMDKAAAHFESMGARCMPLAVSGAWHSETMAPAEAPFRAVLDQIEIAAPARRLYLNVTGGPSDAPDAIRAGLVGQLRNPVRWVDIVQGLMADGVTRFVEVGPGKVLRGTLRRIWPDAGAYEVHSVGDLVAMKRLADSWKA